jgi:hypothetical protein
MGERTCQHDPCNRPRTGTWRYCAMHYYRIRKGRPMDAPPRRGPNPTGWCEIEGCPRKPKGWLCGTHATRRAKYGDTSIVHPGFRAYGLDHPNWVGDDAGYAAVHSRLRRLRGRPARCAHCGSEGSQIQWALDWSRVTDVRYEEVRRRGRVDRLPYSVSPSDYIGLCLRCHRAFDLANAAGRAAP